LTGDPVVTYTYTKLDEENYEIDIRVSGSIEGRKSFKDFVS
jgi:hypothetical protein